MPRWCRHNLTGERTNGRPKNEFVCARTWEIRPHKTVNNQPKPQTYVQGRVRDIENWDIGVVNVPGRIMALRGYGRGSYVECAYH